MGALTWFRELRSRIGSFAYRDNVNIAPPKPVVHVEIAENLSTRLYVFNVKLIFIPPGRLLVRR